MDDVVVIIPSLEPDEKIFNVVKGLQELNLKRIVIINDGSSKKYDVIFEKLHNLGCHIIKHRKNLGKGKSIRDGIKFTYRNYDRVIGYITADGDGQHLPNDIYKIAKKMEENENIRQNNKLILGVRKFDFENVPKRSKFGNKLSSIFFKIQTGRNLNDTQTGLRGIPIKYTFFATKVEGNRYDYEMNFLLNACEENIEFQEVPISTIYEDENKRSHFNIFKDSFLIYKEFFVYLLNSLASAFIDVTGFSILLKIINNISLSNIFARIISGVFNFYVNKKYAFESFENREREIIKYFLLFCAQMGVSTGLVSALSFLNINTTFLKIIVDISIFFVNYFIEKKFIFNKKHHLLKIDYFKDKEKLVEKDNF